MNNNEEISEINISMIGIIIFILILFHSLYILNLNKKKIKDNSVSDYNIVVHSLVNRVIAFLIFLVFLFFDYKDFINSDDNSKKDKTLTLISSLLALIAVIIEIYLAYKNYTKLKESKT